MKKIIIDLIVNTIIEVLNDILMRMKKKKMNNSL